MTPSEHLLETLERYGEQAKEVQLTLIHNGPSVWNEMSRTKVGRYQPCPPLRRRDAGSRLWRGSGSRSLHRQSLPPLSCFRQEAEQQKEELKRPKRKSLTLMEEAWEWLESLGKGKVYSTASEKEGGKRADKRNHSSLSVGKDNAGRSTRSKVRGKEKNLKSDSDHRTSDCAGSKTKDKDYSNRQEAKSDDLLDLNSASAEDEKNSLRETIICQLSCLQDLQVHMAFIDRQITELEDKQRAEKAEQEAEQRIAEEEIEQIKFWENELKAEEGYEKDLQLQFLEMKAKVVECKAKLEDYKHKMQGPDFFGVHNTAQENSGMVSNAGESAATETDRHQQPSDPHVDLNINRKFLPKDDKPPHALVLPNQIKERRPRWSEAQSSQLQTTKKAIHRSELTIYLSSTKV